MTLSCRSGMRLIDGMGLGITLSCTCRSGMRLVVSVWSLGVGQLLCKQVE